jgi:hypothetical protein
MEFERVMLHQQVFSTQRAQRIRGGHGERLEKGQEKATKKAKKELRRSRSLTPVPADFFRLALAAPAGPGSG